MRILIAEDDPVSRLLLKTLLSQWGYDVVAVTRGDEAWQVLQRADAPNLAILDWMMPGMDGIAVCREVRKRQVHHYTYILLLTSRTQKQDVLEGLEAGADDYLTKPFDSPELKARLRAGRRIVELQEELVSARDLLREQSLRDPLTGLWNRRGMLDSIHRELARAAREGKSAGVMMLDLDHFKKINDTYGHMAGDAVLREVARRLVSVTRTDEAVGRYGGEEFMAVFWGYDYPAAHTLAERYRACVGNQAIDTPEGLIPVTLSIGVAVTAESKEANLDRLIRAADTALYRAKRAGRNRAELASHEDWLDAPKPSTITHP